MCANAKGSSLMNRKVRPASGLTVFLALSLVHLLFPIFVVYSWIYPSNSFSLKLKHEHSKRSRLEECIRKAEERELAEPSRVLADPYDGACLGRNRINETLRHATDGRSSTLRSSEETDPCD